MEWESAGRRSFRVGILKFTRSIYHGGVLVGIWTAATKATKLVDIFVIPL